MCNWHMRRKYLMKVPELYEILPARKPCVTDVLCNQESHSQIVNVDVIILGPIVYNLIPMGSQHPSPNVKSLCYFELQIWPEIITSRDAKSACFKGSRMSCDVINVGFGGQIVLEKITSRDSQQLVHNRLQL